MRTRFVNSMFAATFVAGAAFALAMNGADAAPSVSSSLKKPLSAAQESMKSQDFAGALAHVKEAQAVGGLTGYDTFVINQFLGNIYIGQKDYANAEIAFQAMAESPDLPAGDKANVYSTTVQLAINTSKWDVAIKLGEQLQALGPLPDPLPEQLAVAYFNSGDHAKALALAQAQIDKDKAAGKQPSQALLEIAMNGQAGAKDNTAALEALEGLATTYGNPDDWGRLIENEGFVLHGLTDIQALNIYRLRVATDATTAADDYAIMASVTTKAGYPAETVAMLEHGLAKGVIHAGDSTSGALAQARAKVPGDKRDVAAFEPQAAAHKTGDFDVKVAESFFGYGDYAKSEEAARRAMSKGGMKDTAEAAMLLGMSLTLQGKNADAVDVFSKVGGNANDKKIAHLWTLYAQRKYTTPQKP
jgi:tetratricopeptide (TPR) repeat protein